MCLSELHLPGEHFQTVMWQKYKIANPTDMDMVSPFRIYENFAIYVPIVPSLPSTVDDVQ